MRGKKDNIEWEGNIIAAKCPYCNHTGTREVTNAGVFNLFKCPKCERVYRIPEVRVHKVNEEFFIKLNNFDYKNDVSSDDMTPTERWAWWLNFWKENGYYHKVVKNVDGYKLVEVFRYDGQGNKNVGLKQKTFNKDNEVILSCEEPAFLTLEKQDNKIIIRGEIDD